MIQWWWKPTLFVIRYTIMNKSENYDRLEESSPAPLNTHQAITRLRGASCFQIITGFIIVHIFTIFGGIVFSLPYLQDWENITIYCTSHSGVVNQCDKAQLATLTSLLLTSSILTMKDPISYLQYLSYFISLILDKSVGTAYFTGFSPLLRMRVTDLWGHKWMVIGGLIFCLLTHIFYVVKMSVASVYASHFLFGLGLLSLSSLWLLICISLPVI